jgi:DNA-binding NarL/FixJ family response regulator
MPVMNDLQSAPELRKLFPQSPIILFSSYGQSLSRTGASRAGISLVLDKSVPLAAPIEKAHELIAN